METKIQDGKVIQTQTIEQDLTQFIEMKKNEVQTLNAQISSLNTRLNVVLTELSSLMEVK